MPPLVPAWSGTYRDITAGLVQRILRERAAGGADVLERLQSPLEILIPSRGVADTIVAAMSRAFPQGVAGIRLHTPETLALRILNAAGRYPRVAGARDRRLAMLLAAEEIRDARLNTPGIAVMLERSYRDIRDSGVTLQAFARRRDKFPEVSRASSLIDCWRRYEAVLSRCVAIDPADAFHQAIEVLPAADLAPQILFGFYDTTGIQEMFLQALHAAAGIDSIYIPVIPNDPRYSFADRQIRQLSRIFTETASAETRNALPRWSIHRYGTPSEEARETCREIRSFLDGGADPRRIGIVARALDPERIAALERAAADFDLALATPPTRPLSSHPFGRVLRLLLQIREQRFPRAAVVEIASAPIRRDFWGFSFHPERLDSASRRAEIAGGTSAWVRTILPRVETESRHDLEHVLNYIQVVDKLEKLTEPLATSRRGARWAETIETFAEAFHLSTDQDLAALEGLREIAEVCRRADASGTPFDANTIVHLLDTAPAVAPSPPRPLAPSVWVGDVMKARGRGFDHLFVLDMRDGAFPQSRAEDPLVPNEVRRVTGVREIGDGRDEERLLFQLLLDSAETSIQFSFPTSDGMRRVWYASHFLKEFAQQHEPDGNLRPLAIRNFSEYVDRKSSRTPGAASRVERKREELRTGEQALTPSIARSLALVRYNGTNSRFDGYLSPAEPIQRAVDQRLSLISPTHLEYLGQCPQRFLFTTVLDIREIEDPEYEIQINIRKKGGLDHRVLEVLYRTLSEDDFRAVRESGALPDHLRQRLESTIDDQFRRHDADYPAPNQMVREVERKLTRRFLTEFVTADLRDLAETGFRPEHFEYQFGGGRDDREPDHPAVTLHIGGRAVTLRGKMDRVDRNARTGAHRIVDYKMGKGAKFKDLGELIESGRTLQLAFYALAACRIFGVPPERMSAAIRPLRSVKPSDRHSFELAEVLPTLEQALEQLAAAMSAGHFPAFPGGWCDYCAVTNWCRARHDPAQKHALGQFESAVELLQSAASEAVRSEP